MLGVSALTLLVLLCLPTLYSSSAVVMLDQRKNNVADLSSVLSALPTDLRRYKTRYRFCLRAIWPGASSAS